MIDLTLCMSTTCPALAECQRHVQRHERINLYGQSYMVFEPDKGRQCHGFVAAEKQRMSRARVRDGQPVTASRARNDTLEPGDYVLATKYSDGDPGDEWAVGFFVGMLPNSNHYQVVDPAGKLFRGNGFRRARKIGKERGRWLLEHSKDIESGGRSVWWWARTRMERP